MSEGGKILLLLSQSLCQEKGNEELIRRKVVIASPVGLSLCLKTLLLIWTYLGSLLIKTQPPLN